ncbi:MAG: TRAP transporter fused permease subunit [Candidatus Verstraetearchaeota archaeon]|nr:TRAP transporter fused permease subunit [Candidatus Verstraetearchaeota archaeon]
MNKHKFLDYIILGLEIFLLIILIYYYATGYGGSMLLAVFTVPLIFALHTLYSLKENKLYPRLGVKVNYIVGVIYVVLSIIISIYLVVNFDDLRYVRWGSPNTTDYIIGTIALLFIMEYTRRKHIAIFVLNVFLMFYALYGWLFPDIFRHPGVGIRVLIRSLTVDFETGIFERLPQLALTVIGVFMLFSSISYGFGLLNSLINVIMSKLGRRPSTIPMACVINSITIGLPSSSIAANVAVSGSYTIPLMKKIGIPSKYAGVVEAASSVAAQLSPPLMGAAAFIMAEYLRVSYFDVCLRGWILLFIYVVGLLFIVYLLTRRYVIREVAVTASFAYKRSDVINTMIFFFGIALITYLMWIGISPIVAGFVSSVLLLIIVLIDTIVLSILQKSSLKDILKELYDKFVFSIHNFMSDLVDLTLLLSTLGIMTEAMTITGVPPKIGLILMEIGGANVILTVTIAFILGYILGLGLPPTPTYLLTAILVAPYLIKLGFDPWAVHYFAFFMALFSELSPPTSLAAAVASKISGAGFMETLIELMKICTPLFILMFGILVEQPAVSEVSWLTLISVVIITVSIIAFSLGLFGKFGGKQSIDILLRGLLIISSITIFYPHIAIRIPSLILIIGLAYIYFKRSKLRA